MSFSYGSVPPPDSPPLRAMSLSPAPARTDRRAKRQTTALSPASVATSFAGLSLDEDPLDLNANGGRRSDSSLSRNSSIATTSSMLNKRASAAPALPVPRMINPLPPNYQHPPSPAPSAAPSLSHSSSTHESSHSSCYSSGSSIKSSRAPKLNTAVLERSNGASSSDSLSSEPVTPTGATFSRSRYVFSVQLFQPPLLHMDLTHRRPLLLRQPSSSPRLYTDTLRMLILFFSSLQGQKHFASCRQTCVRLSLAQGWQEGSDRTS